jgi:predicted SAM-dependent methyltransferase
LRSRESSLDEEAIPMPMSEPSLPTAGLQVDAAAPVRLHIGAGRVRLEGWVNIDLQPLPGVDVVADVTKGLELEDERAEAIYAEHFLEHLPLDAALDFLLEAYRVLRPGGWMRLSTPNLDWVWMTHYQLDLDPEAKRHAALRINRAFHGWQHRFVWNREMLEEALVACGFAPVRWCRYGESAEPIFHGIEHHETYGDVPDLPHVIIAEVSKGKPRPARLAFLRGLMTREFLDHLEG